MKELRQIKLLNRALFTIFLVITVPSSLQAGSIQQENRQLLLEALIYGNAETNEPTNRSSERSSTQKAQARHDTARKPINRMQPLNHSQHRYQASAQMENDFNKLHRSAKAGNRNAAYRLGMLYTDQTQDPYYAADKSFYWFSEAARRGHPKAQYNLGVAYAKGQGTVQNMIEAYSWFNLAAANGVDGAVQARKMIAKNLPRDAMLEGQERSRLYQAQIQRNIRK